MQNDPLPRSGFVLGISLVAISSAITGCMIFYAGERAIEAARKVDSLPGAFHVIQYSFGQVVHDYKTSDVYIEDGDLKIIQGDSVVTLEPHPVQEIYFTEK